MPGDPVDAVRAFFDAWNRRDEDALRAICHPELEGRSALTAMEGGDGWVHGIEATIALFRNNVETLGFTFRLRDTLVYRSLVLALVDNTATLAERGLELGQEYGMVFEIRDGLITRCLTYFDPAEAFEAMARLSRR